MKPAKFYVKNGGLWGDVLIGKDKECENESICGHGWEEIVGSMPPKGKLYRATISFREVKKPVNKKK